MSVTTFFASFGLILLLTSCGSTSKTATFKLSDHSELKKMRWIEGNWKGMDGENPFYEDYRITSDTSLMITSYSWDGTDSSNSSTTVFSLKNGAYYLGKEDNWKAVSITDSTVIMVPVYKAYNEIVWQKMNHQHWWAARIITKKGEKVYMMQRLKDLKSR